MKERRFIGKINKYMFLRKRKNAYIEAGFPGGSDSKESAYNAGDLSSFPGSGRTSGEGNDH